VDIQAKKKFRQEKKRSFPQQKKKSGDWGGTGTKKNIPPKKVSRTLGKNPLKNFICPIPNRGGGGALWKESWRVSGGNWKNKKKNPEKGWGLSARMGGANVGKGGGGRRLQKGGKKSLNSMQRS